jgi:hypothetical protein
MSGSAAKASGVNQDGPRPAATGVTAYPGPAEPLPCCGKPMEPRLASARDRFGQTMFVAVWRCATCGQTST